MHIRIHTHPSLLPLSKTVCVCVFNVSKILNLEKKSSGCIYYTSAYDKESCHDTFPIRSKWQKLISDYGDSKQYNGWAVLEVQSSYGRVHMRLLIRIAQIIHMTAWAKKNAVACIIKTFFPSQILVCCFKNRKLWAVTAHCYLRSLPCTVTYGGWISLLRSF